MLWGRGRERALGSLDDGGNLKVGNDACAIANTLSLPYCWVKHACLIELSCTPTAQNVIPRSSLATNTAGFSMCLTRPVVLPSSISVHLLPML